MEELISEFWIQYDMYIHTKEPLLRQKLSSLLAQIEKPDRRTQLLRPEKGWDKIIAWQVLRSEEFIFHEHPFCVNAGEILAWSPHWDRDVFLTRIPGLELVSGALLQPGFVFTHNDRGNRNDREWDEYVRSNGIGNRKGLYLPLYEYQAVINFASAYIDESKKKVIDYLATEKGFKG